MSDLHEYKGITKYAAIYESGLWDELFQRNRERTRRNGKKGGPITKQQTCTRPQ